MGPQEKTYPARIIIGGLKGMIRFYQLGISPYLPQSCRYVPTCSRYALEALDEHGALKGGYLTLRRLLRCHPFAKGGYDPVPKKTA